MFLIAPFERSDQKIQKQILLGTLILAGLLPVILAISLPTLQMQPGEFFLTRVFRSASTELGSGIFRYRLGLTRDPGILDRNNNIATHLYCHWQEMGGCDD